MQAELAGVVPIVVTPFDERGRVDEEAIATLVDLEARCGVHGLNVLGIMGEAHKLTEPERRRVAELFVKLEEPPTPTKLTALRRLPGGERLGVFGGMNAMYFLEELGRGAIGVMTGFAFPDILVDVYERFRRGDAAGAAAVYDRYASFIRYEGQQGLALAFRKEVLRRRGAIRTAFVRPPGPVLDDVTRAELAATLERLGLAAQLAR